MHIIHPFAHDFYGHDMSVLVLGYIRPELDYISRGRTGPLDVFLMLTSDALVDDINFDVKVALNSLARPGYAAYASDPYLSASKFPASNLQFPPDKAVNKNLNIE